MQVFLQVFSSLTLILIIIAVIIIINVCGTAARLIYSGRFLFFLIAFSAFEVKRKKTTQF